MARTGNYKKTSETLIKFWAPVELKEALQDLAGDRNISMSALLRLITSAYVKRDPSP